jgi:hypothetical protein
VHRILAIGLSISFALVFTATAAAWSWPADGAVLRSFDLGSDVYAAGQHRGVDVGGPEGSSVRAPAAGVVTFAGSLPTYGRGVTILTGDGYAVTLVHLGEIGVAKGDTVGEGAAVGTMGTSGTPEQSVPSVHLGIRRAADEEGYVDPLGLLPPRNEPAPVPEGEAEPEPAVSPAAAPAVIPAQEPPPAPPAPTTPSPSAATAPPAAATAASSVAAALPSPGAAPSDAGEAGAEPVATAGSDAATAAPAASSAPRAGIEIHATATSTGPVRPGAAPGGVTPTQVPSHGRVPVVRTRAATSAAAEPTNVATQRTGAVGDATPRHRIAPVVGPTGAESTPPAVGGHASTSAHPHDAPFEPGVTVRASETGRTGTVSADPPRRRPVPLPALDKKPGIHPVRGAIEPKRATSGGRPVTAAQEGGRLLRTAAAAMLAFLLAAAVGRRVARRIGMDGALLRHHADLLRQFDAAHRPRLHDRGRGRVRPPSAAART